MSQLLKLKFLQTVSTLVFMVSMCCSLAYMSQWLTPSGNDLRMEFEQVSNSDLSVLPAEVIDNQMPQIGRLVFYTSGLWSKWMGGFGGHLWRYLLFFGTLGGFWLACRKAEYEKPLFWLLIGPSFFFVVKYFYVIDFMLSLFFASWLIVSIQKKLPRWVVFALSFFMFYSKISSVVILSLLLTVFIPIKNWRKILGPIGLSLALSLFVFFVIRNGIHALGHRGHLWLEQPLLVMTSLGGHLFEPWKFFKIFNIQNQTFTLDLEWTFYAKLMVFCWLLIEMAMKDRKQFFTRFAGVLISCWISIAIIRDVPTVHDFTAYVGICYFGLAGIVWGVFPLVSSQKKYLIYVIFGLFFISDSFMWWRSYEEIKGSATKIGLSRYLAQTNSSVVVFFCQENVAEYEFSLTSQKVKYVLNPGDIAKIDYERSAFVVPKKCLHEGLKENLRPVLEEIKLKSRYLKNFVIGKDESYDVYAPVI